STSGLHLKGHHGPRSVNGLPGRISDLPALATLRRSGRSPQSVIAIHAFTTIHDFPRHVAMNFTEHGLSVAVTAMPSPCWSPTLEDNPPAICHAILAPTAGAVAGCSPWHRAPAERDSAVN